jgi:hypothetical protein
VGRGRFTGGLEEVSELLLAVFPEDSEMNDSRLGSNGNVLSSWLRGFAWEFF